MIYSEKKRARGKSYEFIKHDFNAIDKDSIEIAVKKELSFAQSILWPEVL
jgi:hypothetical protein